MTRNEKEYLSSLEGKNIPILRMSEKFNLKEWYS